MGSNKECPAFFKFFSPETSSEQLILPSGFIRCIQGKLPKRVVLKDRHHNYWQVKVGKIGNIMYFQGGWATYVKDSLIESGDLLVFQYLMDGLFNVKMFDPSSLEKEKAQKFMFKGIEGTETIGEENEQEEEEEYIEVVGEEDVEVEGENDGKEDTGEEMEEEDMEEVYEDDTEMEEEEGDMEVGGERNVAEGNANVTSSRKKRIPDIYGKELFQSGLAVKPINPYFITRIISRKSELYIPKEFLWKQSIEFERVTYLVDPKGNKYGIKFKKWKDGRACFCKGWRGFCLSNFVDEDDTFICEFVEGNRGSYIRVSIVRANQGHS